MNVYEIETKPQDEQALEAYDIKKKETMKRFLSRLVLGSD